MPAGGNKDMMKAFSEIKGRVYGKIIDAKTKKPVEFASVVVLWYNKDSLLGGSLTKENGEFSIDNLPAMGGFRFRATQIGYKAFETKIYIQLPNKLEQDLGESSNYKQKFDELFSEKSTLAQQLETIQSEFNNFKVSVQQEKVNATLQSAIEQAGAKSVGTVLKLIDKSKVEFDENGLFFGGYENKLKDCRLNRDNFDEFALIILEINARERPKKEKI
jgi:chaperonin cofactor prefoldin